MSVIVTGRNWWNRLSDDQRRILEESFPTIQESRRVTRAQEKLDLEDPDLEIVVHALTVAQRQKWQNASAGVTDLLLQTIGGRSREIYNLILKGKAEFRSRDRSDAPVRSRVGYSGPFFG